MSFLRIDGSFGEGGGQILRTAITLSCITNQPIILENIRKNRTTQGLRPQHLTAIKILQKVCDADVKDAEVGSTSFSFNPKKVHSATLFEDVRTAGSIPLILQVLIPAAACKANLDLTIRGGTDGKWSPTTNYTQHVLREVYSRMNIQFSMDVMKRGYYPKGGGLVKVNVTPSDRIIPLSLTQRSTKKAKLFCSYSKLPENIISENVNKIKEELTKNNFTVDSKIDREDAFDSGASILLYSTDSQSIIGVDSLFDFKSKKFDQSMVERFIQNDVCVDENLADMVVVPASMAQGMTVFRVKNISKHLETNLHVTSKMTGCKYGVGKIKDGFEIRIEGGSDACI